MKPRVADQLDNFGCTVSVSEFRTVLATVKAELYPDLTDEHLAYTRHEAESYCKEVRTKVGGKLPRVFILTQLCNLRKNGHYKKAVAPASQPVASSTDGQAAL